MRVAEQDIYSDSGVLLVRAGSEIPSDVEAYLAPPAPRAPKKQPEPAAPVADAAEDETDDKE